MTRIHFFWLLAALLAALCYTPTAEAHDGPPRIELASTRLAPGMNLEVRGINIADEQQIAVTLVSAASEVVLGVALGDIHGDFTQTFALPSDLAPGDYLVR